ncbi:unnamed protein product [Brassica rapa]|uniref:Trigger factor C-terminal domain-containing protein n=1 Tax=Brassica campestris TaxID=3711 RepID=A0A8D9MFQ5_BRACM|nr:unnamed protein product [Brassica rapa]
METRKPLCQCAQFTMVEVEIPQSLFEEQGRQFYGARLLEIQQNLAVGDIFKRKNLEFSTDELVKEVENSITEFRKHKQEYDEERVKDQVSSPVRLKYYHFLEL